MAGQEVLSSHRGKPASHRKVLSHRRERPSPSGRFKRLSDRVPLRTKLITAVLALVIMALAAISVASVVVLRDTLYTQRDIPLRGQFNGLMNGFEALSVSGPPEFTLGITANYGSGFTLAFQNPGSQLVAGNAGSSVPIGNAHKMPAIPVQSLPRLPAGIWAPSSGYVLTTVPAQSGGDAWRVIAEAVVVTNAETGAQQTSIMMLAVDLGPVGAEIQRLITVELIVGTSIVLVLAVVGVGVVRANLRPLDDIEMIAGEIAKGHLDHRIPERDPRTEIGSLGQSLNIMLSQIETAFRSQEESERAAHASEERMRRFTADAAHELRTPLTTIRGFSAHYRQRGGALSSRGGPAVASSSGIAGAGGAGDHSRSSRTEAWFHAPADRRSGGGADAEGLSPEELDRLMSRIESEADRMGLLVEDLLTLARLDQQRPLNIAPVDLLTLAADAVQDARIVSPDRPIDLAVAPGAAFIVDGDEPRLRQVISNLVNNAITHTPAGTPVRVKIAPGVLQLPPTGPPGPAQGNAGGWGIGPAGRPVPAVVLDIEDDGPGMSAEQAQRVFERFYRADAARNRASGGTGLGLAIVAGLVSAHGGTVSVRTAPGQGADFQVKLPLAPDALAVDDPEADEDFLG
jgi:two-component system OmpR family sensor kinase